MGPLSSEARVGEDRASFTAKVDMFDGVETESLGYDLTCTGVTARNEAAMLGGCHINLRNLKVGFGRLPAARRVFWWKLWFQGIPIIHGAYVGCSETTVQELLGF